MARPSSRAFASLLPTDRAADFRIAAGVEGGYMLAYSAPAGESSATNQRAVHVLRLDDKGRPTGDAIRIDGHAGSVGGSLIHDFDVLALEDGGYAVASRNQVGSAGNFPTYLTYLDSGVRPVGPTVLVHQTTTFQSMSFGHITLSESPDGVRASFGLAQSGVARQIWNFDVSTDGVVREGPSFLPASISAFSIAPTSLDSTTLDNGKTVIIADGGTYIAAWMTAPGGRILRDFRVDRALDFPATGISPDDASIAALETGGFVVVWSDARMIAGAWYRGIIAQRYDGKGDPIGDFIGISDAQHDGAKIKPSVIGLDTGGFLVAWVDHSDSLSDDRNMTALRAREFGATGQPVGREFTLQSDRPATGVDLAQGVDGRVLATWYTRPEGAVWDAIAQSRLLKVEAPDFAGIIAGNGRNNRLVGQGDSDDILDGRNGDDQLFGGRGHDELYGGKGRDLLLGGRGNDILNGGPGSDTLRGGNGNDTLVSGGPQQDILFGGAGKDSFIFRSAGYETRAIIRDFNVESDHIAMYGYGLHNAYQPKFRETTKGLLFVETSKPGENYRILLEGIRSDQIDDISFSFF